MTLGAPDDQHRTLNRVPGLDVGAIHVEVNGRPGTVVLAHGMELLRRAAPGILGDRLRTKTALANPHRGELLLDVVAFLASQELLRHIVRLRHKGPVKRIEGPLSADMRPEVMRGND